MTGSESLRLATKLRAYFPTMSEESVMAYGEAIRPLDLDVATEAVGRLVLRATRLPTVADVRGACREVEQATSSPRLGLPGPSGVEMPPEVRGRWRALAERAAKPPPVVEEYEGSEHLAWPVTVEPVIATNGPACPMGHGSTVHDGGNLWWCQTCGWVKRR